MKIYVAGPFTKGDQIINIREAILMGDCLLRLGHIPYIPHLTGLWHMLSPHPVYEWYNYDNEWLRVCDALFRMHGESGGADDEVMLMTHLGRPVYYNLSEVPLGD